MQAILRSLGIQEMNSGACTGTWISNDNNDKLDSFTPVDGSLLASVNQAAAEDYEKVVAAAREAFTYWRAVPAPKRGEIVRQIGNELRAKKEELGALVALEMGKIKAEGLGEVQEMIDICDFAVGLSRQLYGLTIKSEREKHQMLEQWHPLGVVGIISAFNFPVAVWAWNAALAAVCGDTMIWKPSSKTPLTAIAVQHICNKVTQANHLPDGIFNLVVGRGSVIGERLINDKRVPLISATGSTKMGIRIGRVVGERLGKAILELGGNNAIIISQDADLEMAKRAVVFGAVGTAGQRCTSTRRLLIHESIYDKFVSDLIATYKTVRIGNPLAESTLMGPLVDAGAVAEMQNAIEEVKKQGGKMLYGGEVLTGEGYENGLYVTPAIAEVENHYAIVQDETFAPLLYVMKYKAFEDALQMHNDVPQGLSSAIFSNNMREVNAFISEIGSDCGIANANIGTSGAEIGGAFGGEKETGGGRESGSDSWKMYMRRQTNTINWGTDLPLAQGISFGE
jgi:aldehyde dehydrogenase (NAD+)